MRRTRRSRHHDRTWWIAVGLFVAAFGLTGTWIGLQFVQRPVHDLVVLDATIHDGSGRPAFRGSIGIDGDRIVALYAPSLLVRPTGRTTIIADGLDVAPGFIDTHTHADQNILGSSGP